MTAPLLYWKDALLPSTNFTVSPASVGTNAAAAETYSVRRPPPLFLRSTITPLTFWALAWAIRSWTFWPVPFASKVGRRRYRYGWAWLSRTTSLQGRRAAPSTVPVRFRVCWSLPRRNVTLTGV